MECTSEGRNGSFGKMKKEGWLWREGRVATSGQKCEWDDSRCLRVFKSGKLDLKITWTLPQVPSVSRCVTLPGCDMMKWYRDRYNWCSDRYNIQLYNRLSWLYQKKPRKRNEVWRVTPETWHEDWHVQMYCRVAGTGGTFMESDATLGFIYIWKSEKIFR